jgi:UDP-2,3-diacylglucosamine pyrophosphatase LpxH
VKDSVKGVVKYVNNFEETAAEIACFSNYQYVVCGQIHQPQIRKMKSKDGAEVLYLNAGDWVENSTALEYHQKEWTLYRHDPSVKEDVLQLKEEHRDALNYESLLREVVSEIHTN